MVCVVCAGCVEDERRQGHGPYTRIVLSMHATASNGSNGSPHLASPPPTHAIFPTSHLLAGGDPLLVGPEVLVRGRRQKELLGALWLVFGRGVGLVKQSTNQYTHNT